jgi:hypothetical protein
MKWIKKQGSNVLAEAHVFVRMPELRTMISVTHSVVHTLSAPHIPPYCPHPLQMTDSLQCGLSGTCAKFLFNTETNFVCGILLSKKVKQKLQVHASLDK